MAFTRFCLAALGGQAITLYGSGDQVRDFTFIDDIVEANVAALTCSLAPGTVMNLSGGTNASVNDALQVIAELTGRRLVVERTPAVDGDVERTGGDSSLAADLLGWRPTTTLRAGLDRHLEWAARQQT
jgi:nucleoside-diphosphate-sugar epimerase